MKNTFLLKGKDGSIVAKGTLFQGVRNTIHGKACHKDCKVVTIEDVVQVGAEPWFEDKFEDTLTSGMMVEWPDSMMCGVSEVSPMHTRAMHRK